MKKNSKIMISAILAVAMGLSLVGCGTGGKTQETNNSDSTATKIEEKKEQQKTTAKAGEKFDLKGFTFEFSNFREVQDKNNSQKLQVANVSITSNEDNVSFNNYPMDSIPKILYRVTTTKFTNVRPEMTQVDDLANFDFLLTKKIPKGRTAKASLSFKTEEKIAKIEFYNSLNTDEIFMTVEFD
ncbi:MAG: hypothetical protein ACRCV7_04125 [Culicoidibacterales bacterium]